ADRSSQRRAAGDARDPADHLVALEDQVTLLRQGAILAWREGDAGQAARQWLGLQDGQTALADEEWLVLAQRPLQVRLVRVGQRVGVLAQDEVPLLQPQQSLGLDAEGPDAVSPAGVH